MPKAFSSNEKDLIRDQLRAEGMKQFAKSGVRAARVEDICKNVGIAKGSFYSFYPSKELLFLDIADIRDDYHKDGMRRLVESSDLAPRQMLESLFDDMLVRSLEDPVLRVVRDHEEMAYITRKVPPLAMAESAKRGRAFVAELADILQRRHGLVHATAEIVESLMTLTFCTVLQQDHLAAAHSYDTTMSLMRELFVGRLLKGPLYD